MTAQPATRLASNGQQGALVARPRMGVACAEWVLDLDGLRADRGVMDVVDADDYVTGEAPAPIAVVTDNGP